MKSRNVIGRKRSMVIPLLANQDLTPMLAGSSLVLVTCLSGYRKVFSHRKHPPSILLTLA